MRPVPAQIHRTAQTGPDGQALAWERAHIDGAPYLGHAPARTEAEYKAQTAAVRYFRNGTFDTTVPDQNAAYCEVMTRCCNGWYRLHRQDPIAGTTQIYLEWIEKYVADVARPRGI